MKSVLEKFQFFIEHPDDGEIRVWPNNNELEFQWRREEKQIFYRKHLETELNFVNDSNRDITDFDTLYELDRSQHRCKKISFIIKQFPCSGNAEDEWPVVWEGNISLVDANTFDVDRCVVRIKPRISDRYDCIFDNWENEVNILEAPILPFVDEYWSVETVVLTHDYVNDYQLENPEFPPPGTGPDIYDLGYQNIPLLNNHLWTPIDNDIRFYEIENPPDPNKPWTFEITTILQSWVYVSQCVNGVPVPPVIAVAAPNPVLINLPEVVEDCESEGTVGVGFAKWRKPIAETTIIPPGGRSMEEVLNILLDESCELTVQSHLFGIGGIGDRPDNQTYNWAVDNLSKLVLYHISDITTKDPDEFATRAEIKLKDLLDDLAELNIFWTISEDGGDFILEHISYFLQENRTLNLTESVSKQFIQGRHNYKYLQERLPRVEKYAWKVEAERDFKKNVRSNSFIPGLGRVGTTVSKKYNQLSFDAGELTYDNACGNKGADREYQFKTFITNIADVLENPDAYPEDLIVMVATRGNYLHITEETFPGNITTPGSYQARTRVNSPLTLAELMKNLIRYNRPQWSAEMRDIGITIEMLNAMRLREQDEISIPMCCDDLINEFDPADLVKTQLGWGEIREATLKEPYSEMKLNLLFR